LVIMFEKRGIKLGLLDFSPYHTRNSVHWFAKKRGPQVDKIWYLKTVCLGSKTRRVCGVAAERERERLILGPPNTNNQEE